MPIARHDKAVQVGGTNVYPREVEKSLRTHPKIKDCTVRLMLPCEGDRLKAFIVPINQTKECLDKLTGQIFRTWLNLHLTDASTPKHITIGQAIPMSETGKLCDWSIHK